MSAASRLPWAADGLTVEDAGGYVIADCDFIDMDIDESIGNAALIARAVNCHAELLAALKEVVAISDREHNAWDAARAAIAHAEAQS